MSFPNVPVQLYTAAYTSFNGSLQPGGYGLTARE